MTIYSKHERQALLPWNIEINAAGKVKNAVQFDGTEMVIIIGRYEYSS